MVIADNLFIYEVKLGIIAIIRKQSASFNKYCTHIHVRNGS